MTTLPCLRCGQPLPSVLGPAADINQPAGGTVFTSYGQYGSTVFDEADGSFLEISICDPCLLDATAAGQVLIGAPSRQPAPPPPVMAQWDGWGLSWCAHCRSAVITAEHVWHDDGSAA